MLQLILTSRWDFKAHSNDIKFGVRAYNLQNDEKFNEVDLKRVASTDGDETGFITCQPNHKCKQQREFVY